jgi:LemA protein
MSVGALLLLALVGLGFAVVGIYNALVRLRVQATNAWSDIDVQLKRRYDLIPNLVETVKGYAGHERKTFEDVVSARSRAMSAEGPAAKGEAEGALTQALKSLFAVAEPYPQLRAVETFSQLQSSLNEIEDSVQNARRYYNAVVRDLNTRIAQFPSNIVAGRQTRRITSRSRDDPAALFRLVERDLQDDSGRIPHAPWLQL